MKSQDLRKKVYVGLSGGVDSSVSAALLKKQGYQVTGVFIKVWQPDFYECTWKEDRLDAMRVCAKLNIPFVTLNLEKEYKREVVDYMIREYKVGRTPNPDVMCNKYVKFGAFFKWAIKNGADYVATGHYAQAKKVKNGRMTLSVSNDKEKDQTYFLWTLSERELKKTLFPVGHLTKTQVRRYAKKFDLPTALKKDSQGLCFIGKVNMKEFLSHYVTPKQGKVLDTDGTTIGYHRGSLFFTLGERHGFTITKKTAHDTRLFVVKKDLRRNTITVARKLKKQENPSDSDDTRVTLTNVHWISREPHTNKPYYGRVRYRQPLAECFLEHMSSGKATIQFTKSQSFLTPGQSLVIYNGAECVGGGIISN